MFDPTCGVFSELMPNLPKLDVIRVVDLYGIVFGDEGATHIFQNNEMNERAKQQLCGYCELGRFSAPSGAQPSHP